ncbi:MAG: hypothetical protein H6Q05_628 [Acidobacteria bacterium]|nr:hypothetical protein [Acidobacteriota bacterium]
MRKSLSFVWIGLVGLLSAQLAFAQAALKEMPPGKWWTNKRIIADLRLSMDQQARIDAIWTQSRRTLIDRKAELDRCQVDLEEVLGKDAVDEAAALRAFDRLLEARNSLERGTFQMRIQIKNQLSPEQQQRLETISEFLRPLRKKGNTAAPAVPPVLPARKSGR